MQCALIRILIVDDYDPWRRFTALALSAKDNVQIVGEAPDGLTAILKTLELKPDLVILDIGLPDLSGIEVAREIRNISPETKILFLTENTSQAVIREALKTGAKAYVVKSGAARDLLPAFESLLAGDAYVSPLATGYEYGKGPLFGKCGTEH